MLNQIRALFVRSASPPRFKSGESPEDWQPGDLAECRALGPWKGASGVAFAGPRLAEVRPVQAAVRGQHPDTGAQTTLLVFAAYPSAAFHALHFVRRRPHAEHFEAADAAFIASLKPARVPEHVT